LNFAKAHFFDAEVQSDWSSKEYDQDELIKIERILATGLVQEGSRAVEPGCGTGRLTIMIAKIVGPSGLVVANDISPKMVEEAGKRLRGCSNVRLTWGTIEDAKLEHASFDRGLAKTLADNLLSPCYSIEDLHAQTLYKTVRQEIDLIQQKSSSQKK